MPPPILLLLLLLFLLVSTPLSTSDPLPSSVLALPLVLVRPNASRDSFRRRKLATADARMRLYDDLLTNGYYSTRLFIGTPPQEFALIVDSGSSVTYVPCSTCEHCGKHQDPWFQPGTSSTYKPLNCSAGCVCDREKNQCTYERQYAEMSTSSGVLGEDIVSFGKESALQPQRAIFGCENMETGDLYTQRADGIMGLGRGQLSIVDQLVGKGVISDSFSMCYGGMDLGGGVMVLGDVPPPKGMVFTNSNAARSPYYNIDLAGIDVSGKALHLNPGVFDGKHGTVLDSGTTYAYLPEPAFVAFKDAIMKGLHSLKQIPGPDTSFKDVCFSGAGSNIPDLSKTFPQVDMVFSNGQKILLTPENYLFRHSKVHGAYCLGIFQNGKDQTTLLGGIIVRNTLVTYDRENERIGFWKTNCSNFMETSRGLYPPGHSEERNSSTGPTPSPGGMQKYKPGSGQYRIAVITFSIHLSVNYSFLSPHITELTDVMKQELEVSASQVHLLNITSERNGTLVRWAIFPPDSDDFISNSTAMAIISRLTEHRVHLQKFGSYQLVDWKFETLPRRTWQQKHVWVIALVILAVAVLASLVILVWFWYRRRNGSVAYRSVDAPAPEQEMQPL